MGIFSGIFKSRDAPTNRTVGSAYSFFLGQSAAGKRVNERVPFVCDSCSEKNKKACKYNKYYYLAEKADAKAKKVRSESREGIRLSQEKLQTLDEILSPLIRQWCFDGLPESSSIAISSNGCMPSPYSRRIFLRRNLHIRIHYM